MRTTKCSHAAAPGTDRSQQLRTGAAAHRTSRQHVRPCPDCPWARTSMPGWLGTLSADEWLAAAHGRTDMQCHCLKGASGAWQCAGAAQYRKHRMIRPMPPQLTLDTADHERVFSSPEEFKSHHEGGLQCLKPCARRKTRART